MNKRRFTIVTRPICTREDVLRCPLGGERSEAEESATYKVGDEVMRQVLKGRRAPLGHFTTRRRMICHVKANGTIGKRTEICIGTAYRRGRGGGSGERERRGERRVGTC